MSVGFLAGALFTGILLTSGPGSAASRNRLGDDCGESALARSPDTPGRPAIAVPVPLPRPGAPAAESTLPRIGADPIANLRRRQLAIPVRGVERDDLRSSFDEERGSNRRHEAMDILAPRHTPVLAVEDGTIARLFASQAGGNTIYQYDPSSAYVYYYAHLQRYAPGLEEGGRVKRGDVIGFVGTSGNAPETTPHLHFAIFKMTDQKQWWQGTPIDPFDILGGERK